MANTEKAPAPNSAEEEPRLGPLLISVDDVGQFLALTQRRLVLGHMSDGQADLPFLANVGARHALLERQDTLRHGTLWWVAPMGAERISINGIEVRERRALVSGDLLRLSDNLALTYSSPDPASQSALFELQGREECLGAQRVLLLAAGPGGRLRIGSGAQRLIRVPNLESELCLEVSQSELTLSCSEPLSSAGSVHAQRLFRLALPLLGTQLFSLGKPSGARPPFGLGISSPGGQAVPGEPGSC